MMAINVGVFDGVHRGHRHLLQTLKRIDSGSVALTFSNHPLEVLRGITLPLLTPLPLKLALLKELGLDRILVLPFTRELSSQSYIEFLAPYPIQCLILGEGDAFGKGRQGNAEALQRLGKEKGFSVEIVPKLQDLGAPISSSRIRTLVEQGDLTSAEQLLGRPYCFLPGSTSIVLPPDGIYPVWACCASGPIKTTLVIEHRIARPIDQEAILISFGSNINPTLVNKLCQPTSLAAL